jgi:hypothetical protein
MTEQALWLYGVMAGDAPDLPHCPGVDARRDARLIRHADLAAVVSPVPRREYDRSALEQSLDDLERLEALARGHERVLDEALRVGAVVPVRLCTIYDGPERVRAMLDREHASLAEALQRLRGTAEWGVKAFLVAPEAEADPAAPATGIEYLARKRQARDDAEATRHAAETTAERIHRRLSRCAIDAMLTRVQDRRLSGREEEMILNAAYLVAEARTAEFQTLFRELKRRHGADGVELALTGPWPAYHFARSPAGE